MTIKEIYELNRIKEEEKIDKEFEKIKKRVKDTKIIESINLKNTNSKFTLSHIIKTNLEEISEIKGDSIKKIFFHKVEGMADKTFIIMNDNYVIVLPIIAKCPIEILSEEGLKADIKDFANQILLEEQKLISDINKRKTNLKEIIDEFYIK